MGVGGSSKLVAELSKDTRGFPPDGGIDDGYDPRDPRNIMPATEQQVEEGHIALLSEQIVRLELALSHRGSLVGAFDSTEASGNNEGVCTVLEHYRHVLDSLKASLDSAKLRQRKHSEDQDKSHSAFEAAAIASASVPLVEVVAAVPSAATDAQLSSKFQASHSDNNGHVIGSSSIVPPLLSAPLEWWSFPIARLAIPQQQLLQQRDICWKRHLCDPLCGSNTSAGRSQGTKGAEVTVQECPGSGTFASSRTGSSGKRRLNPCARFCKASSSCWSRCGCLLRLVPGAPTTAARHNPQGRLLLCDDVES